MTAITARSARRRTRRLACLLGLGVTAIVAAAPAAATVPIGEQVRMSVTGPDGDPAHGVDAPVATYNPRTGQHLLVWHRATPTQDRIVARLVDGQGAPVGAEFPVSDANRFADEPAVAYDTRTNEYLVAFERDTATPGEREIYVQRLSAAGVEVGDDTRISHMGPDGDLAYDARDPMVAYDETRDEYMVAWDGDTDAGGRVDDEFEVYVQRLTSGGAQVGANDQRISDMGINANDQLDGSDVDIAWNEVRDEYMVVWEGDDVVDAETEVYAQRLGGDGTELGTDDRCITDVGPPGNPDYDASDPSVAYNPATDEYMVAFEGDDDTAPLVAGENEIFIQRLAYDGSEVGADDRRISDMGPDGDVQYDAYEPKVTTNIRANEFMVTWEGDDDTAPLVEDKFEVFAQRLSATGAELDGNDVRVSSTPAEGDVSVQASDGTSTYDSRLNQFLVVWSADSSVAPMAPGDVEVYARRFGAGTAVTAQAAQCKALPALATPPKGDPSKITLTVDQLLINQRIDQAAIRRANGVQDWLDAGVESRDLCQGVVDSREMYAGTITGYTGVPYTLGPPDPRPVVVPPAVPGDPSKVTLTIGQLLINQRISQAAIRRLNALKARLDAGLTSGDVDDGAVGRAQLTGGTRVLFSPVVSPAPAATVTTIAPPSPGDPSKVTLTTGQLLINQRISQAAVKRANELIHRLGEGIGPEELRDGTLVAADLAPGLPASTTP